MRTLFLNPPSFEGFDGGAGSRWPASREIESYWYPVWLAYPAGMLEDSKLVDGPPHKFSIEQTVAMAKRFRTAGAVHLQPGVERRRPNRRNDEGRQSQDESGIRGAAGNRRARKGAALLQGHRLRGAPRVRSSDRAIRQGNSAGRTSRRQLLERRRDSAQSGRRRHRESGRAAVGDESLQARPRFPQATTFRFC